MPQVSRPSSLHVTSAQSDIGKKDGATLGGHKVEWKASEGAMIGKSKGAEMAGAVKPEDSDRLMERDVEQGSGAHALVQLATELDRQVELDRATHDFQNHFSRNAKEALSLLNAGHFTQHLGSNAHEDGSILQHILSHPDLKVNAGDSEESQVECVNALLNFVDDNIHLGSPEFFDKMGHVIHEMNEEGLDVGSVAGKMLDVIGKYDEENPDAQLSKGELHQLMREVSEAEGHSDKEHVEDKKEKDLKRKDEERERAEWAEGAMKEDIGAATRGFDHKAEGEMNRVVGGGEMEINDSMVSNASHFESDVRETFGLYNSVTTGSVNDDDLRELVVGSFDDRADGLSMLKQQTGNDIQDLAQEAVEDVLSGSNSICSPNWFCQQLANYDNDGAVQLFVDTFLVELAEGTTDAQRVASWIQDVLETIKVSELDNFLTSVFDLVANPETNPSFQAAIQEALDAAVNDKYDVSRELQNKIRDGIEDAEERGVRVKHRSGE